MDIDIENLAKIVSENLNLKDFKGDIVGVKVVENQIGTIEPGGIGIQYNNGISSEGNQDIVRNKQVEDIDKDSRKAIVDELMDLAENGDWVEGITAEDIKTMLGNVLGMDGTQLSEENADMSEKLWGMLEHGRGGDRIRITWQNIVGYLLEKKIIKPKSAPEINIDFFGDKNGSDNINKGRNGRLSKVTSLLDAYLPKMDKKR